jgi:dipeptidyl aminopeptidase/acylaminoacyl peptidase
MNTINDFDELLTAWLADEAPTHEPDGLASVALARTRRTRQVASAGLLERWLPMGLTLRRPMLAMPMRLLAIMLALLLLLIAAMSVPLLFGTRSLPAVGVQQFRNGLIVWAKDGDIWVVDPEVGEPRILIGGPETDDWPDWSPDGTRLAFQRAVGVNSVLMVADADGTNVHPATPELPAIDWWAWSPDSSRFAVARSDGGESSRILIAAADGSSFEMVRVGFDASQPWWHPDGSTLLFRAGAIVGSRPGAEPQAVTLRKVVVPDDLASGPTPRSDQILGSDTSSAFFASDKGAHDLMEAGFSPDGSLIVYLQGQLASDGSSGVFGGPDTRNHVVNADGTGDQVIEFSPTSDYEDGSWFSPDGTRLSMVIREGDYHQIAIMTLDRSRPPVATEPESDPNAMPAIWSPDGKLILAIRVADGISYLIDPDTGEKTRQPWLANWADWQPIPIAP